MKKTYISLCAINVRKDSELTAGLPSASDG